MTLRLALIFGFARQYTSASSFLYAFAIYLLDNEGDWLQIHSFALCVPEDSNSIACYVEH